MEEPEFTFDYFQDEFSRFWDMCGDRRMTLEALERAFNGLFFLASKTTATPEENQRINFLLATAGANFGHRTPYFMLKDLRKA